jgi:hypothetical protein
MKSIVIVLSMVFLVSCTKDAKSSYQSMVESACKGDVLGFYNYIDKDAVATNIVMRELAKKDKNPNPFALAMAEKMIPTMAKKMWEGIEADMIKSKEKSKFCKSKVSAHESNDNESIVTSNIGKRITVFIFKLKGEKWMLSDMIKKN